MYNSHFQPKIAMRTHYRELYELVRYIHYIRTHGEISILSSESELRSDLLEVEWLVKSLLCSLQIGMDAEEETTNTDTSRSLSPNFLSRNTNYRQEMRRSYVVIADAERLIGYLNIMYKEIHFNLIMQFEYMSWY